jgi:hypothetical protein
MTEDLHTRLIFITCVIAVAAATDGIGLYTGTLGGNGGRGKWGGNGEMGDGLICAIFLRFSSNLNTSKSVNHAGQAVPLSPPLSPSFPSSGAKSPALSQPCAARLKSCPDTKHKSREPYKSCASRRSGSTTESAVAVH